MIRRPEEKTLALTRSLLAPSLLETRMRMLLLATARERKAVERRVLGNEGPFGAWQVGEWRL